MAVVLAVVLAYLLGSISTACLASQFLKGADIRNLGDGNAGAANIFGEIGPWAGIAVGLLDAGKGILAILIARALAIPDIAVLLTGVAVVIGHNWPIFFRFKGGMGEAATIGVLLIIIPLPMSICLSIAVIPLLIKRSVIFASVFLFVPLPFVAWLCSTSGMLTAYSILLPSLVGFTHFLTSTRKKPALALGKETPQ